jgi:hypothetical protein
MKEQISKYYMGNRRSAQVTFELDFEEKQKQGYDVSMQEWGDGSWGTAAWFYTSIFLILPWPIILWLSFDIGWYWLTDIGKITIFILGALNVIGVFSFLYLQICKPAGLLSVIYEKEIVSAP